MLCGVGEQLELADDLPGEAASPSPACSSYPLCFDVSIFPHPYVHNCLEIPELALRDSAGEFMTVPEQASPRRGKSLARKDLFWPFAMSHNFWLSCFPFQEGLCPPQEVVSYCSQTPAGCKEPMAVGHLVLPEVSCCNRDSSSI